MDTQEIAPFLKDVELFNANLFLEVNMGGDGHRHRH